MSADKDAESNVTPLSSASRKRTASKKTQAKFKAKTPEAKARQVAAGKANLAKSTRVERARAKGPKDKKVEKSRMQQLIQGEITVADLDDEELYRMQTRDRLGDFARVGKVPQNIIRQMKQESIRRAQGLIDASVGDAVKLLTSVVNAKEARLQDRLKAADILMARGMGSVPTHVINHEGTKWDEMVDSADDVVVVYDEGDVG